MAIIFCVCLHRFQDKQNGPQLRVANKRGSGGKKATAPVYRCTVCGKETGAVYSK